MGSRWASACRADATRRGCLEGFLDEDAVVEGAFEDDAEEEEKRKAGLTKQPCALL